jgi:hypothetical protein
MRQDGRDGQTAAGLLRRAAEVLRDCETSVAGIETVVAPLADRGFTVRDRMTLQDIDLLRQRLGDLATCLSGVADHQSRNVPFDAAAILAPLRLEGLRDRLCGLETEAVAGQSRCDIF